MADADRQSARRTRVPESPVVADALREFLERPDRGLLVDLDGTLVHSETANQRALRRYFRQRGWDVADDLITRFSGRRAHEVFAAIEGPWRGEDPLLLTRGVQRVLSTMKVEPEPVAGAAQLLAACVSTGLPVAVVTSATRAWSATMLRSLNVDVAAIRMVTDEDCTFGKPDPEPFFRGATLLGEDPSDLVAIDDAPAGVASALAAGMGLVVGVTTGHPAERLQTAGAHVTASDLRGLADAVASRRSPCSAGRGDHRPRT